MTTTSPTSPASSPPQLPAALATISTEAATELAPVWSLPPTSIATALFEVIPPLLDRWGLAAASAAADWYDHIRDTENISGRFAAIVEPLGDLGANALAGWAAEPLTLPEPDLITARYRANGGMQKRLVNAANQTLTGSAEHDPQARGYMRKTRPGACKFCRMVASRGGVYTKKSSTFACHETCFCEAVPAWGGRALPVGPYKPSDRPNNATERARVRKWISDNLGDEPPAPKAKLLPKIKPEPKPEPLLSLPRKTKMLDPSADLALVNPRHKDSLQWQINCTRCSTTVELRARGYDVTATPKPKSKTDNDYASILNRWLSPDGKTVAGLVGDKGSYATVNRLGAASESPRAQLARGFKPAAMARTPQAGETPLGMAEVDVWGERRNAPVGASRVWDYLPAGAGQNGAAKAAADEAVLAWGPGARGFITVEWKKRSAHIFNVENRNGKVVYLDGQINKLDNADAWDRIKSTSKTCRIVRTDDLTPRSSGPNATGVEEWVIPRDAKYLKAEQKRLEKQAAKEAEAAAEKERLRKAHEESKALVAKGEKPPVTQIIDAAKNANVTRLGDFVKGVNDAHAHRTLGKTFESDEERVAYNAGVLFFRKWRMIHRI